uniref:ShKT domain-containing protein n=1 Tax=Haemonchus placei TaxID=6290 RepID=A0A0N4WVE5_HAEPC
LKTILFLYPIKFLFCSSAPFILRTCANKNMGCLAGPAICKFSGGSGSCSRCETDNCNL